MSCERLSSCTGAVEAVAEATKDREEEGERQEHSGVSNFFDCLPRRVAFSEEY